MKRAWFGIAAFVVVALLVWRFGSIVHAPPPPVATLPKTGPAELAAAALQRLLDRTRAHDESVTAHSRRLLQALANVKDSLRVLAQREQEASKRAQEAESALQTAKGPQDSLPLLVRAYGACTQGWLTCGQRAALAEAGLDSARTQLARQVAIIPKRWWIGAFTGPSVGPRGVSTWTVGVGLVYRIF